MNINLMKRASGLALGLCVSAQAALAAAGGNGNGNANGFDRGTNNPHGAPEIDASAGFLAIAAILAALVLAWELRRRRNA